MRKQRDVKFIIYQSLYIFVIAVIALKGANIDLTEVMPKNENLVERSYADSLKKYVDSLLAKGLIPQISFDTTQKFQNPEQLKEKLAQITQQLMQVQSISSMTVSTTSPNMTVNTSNVTTPEQQKIVEQQQKKQEESEFKENKTDVDFRISQSFTQYTMNTVNNTGNNTIEVIADGSVVASVPPGGSRSFQLGGQKNVTFKSGNQTKSVATKENQKPKISLQRLAPSGDGVSLRSVQNTVGYRVTINDDYPGQIDVNFAGPVSVKKASENTYDVTLKFLGSKDAFERFTENKDSPYTVSFQINVKDKIAPHSLTQTGVFQFSEW
jgi:hypothetical protein